MSTQTLTADLSRSEFQSTPPGGRPSVAKFVRTQRPFLLGLFAVVLLILAWQVEAALSLINPTFLPPPGEVFSAMWTVITGPTFWNDMAVSGYEFGVGLGLSIIIGGVLGIITGWYKAADEFFRPLIIGLNSMPHLAVIPLLILVFGTGTTTKVVVVLLSCVVVMAMNTAAGVEGVDTQLLRMSRSFGGSDWATIRTIVLPSLIPFFMTGVRISVGRAVAAVVVAEIFASNAGLGNIVVNAQNAFNLPVMYAAVIILTVLGIILTQAAGWLERRLQRWKA